MSIFTVTITDPQKLAGITAARTTYNTTNALVPGFTPLDDPGYVQFVMDSASASYANHYSV